MTHLWGRKTGGDWQLLDEAGEHNFIDFVLEQYRASHGDEWEFITTMGERP